jgi:glucosylceramidase
MSSIISNSYFFVVFSVLLVCCTPKVDKIMLKPVETMDYWLTKGDQSVLLQKQSIVLPFHSENVDIQSIEIDTNSVFQMIDGFGFTLTGGSAQVIHRMKPMDKAHLLKELFEPNQLAINYLRISIGASDLNDTTFTYDDMPQGQTDLNLTHFSLNPDKQAVIPLLKEILRINPNLKILATPWSPPVWMKDTNRFIGGRLQTQYYKVYAQYFVKYIQQMKAEGIDIEAITPQNEPLHPENNPSLLMVAEAQLDFIKNHLGPAFRQANIKTKIIIYDHNCDRPDYPLSILKDSVAKSYLWGTAFHLYAGDINVLTQIHNAHPDKHLYFTEQYTAAKGDFGGDLTWHLKNVVIGSMRNWSRTAFEWNLANDTLFKPHTIGGCTTCKGALTIGNTVTRNVAYYIIGHASKFVPVGSVRIGSNRVGELYNVAFKTPKGQKVLIVVNCGRKKETFSIKCNQKSVILSLSAGDVATYVW